MSTTSANVHSAALALLLDSASEATNGVSVFGSIGDTFDVIGGDFGPLPPPRLAWATLQQGH